MQTVSVSILIVLDISLEEYPDVPLLGGAGLSQSLLSWIFLSKKLEKELLGTIINVSILIVLDISLEANMFGFSYNSAFVSILIVLDISLEE